MHDTPTHFLNIERRALGERLTRLPRELTPPFDFAELQRRGVAREQARRAAPRNFGIAAALVGVLTGALLWQSLAPPAAAPRRAAVAAAVAQAGEPALVRVGTRAAASNIEEHIAWLDDALSESRVQGGTAANLAALERNRSQLMASLRQVRYAEELMTQ